METLANIIKAAGGVNALAHKLGISSAAVAVWKRVPAQRLAEVSRITGISTSRLRPDLAGFAEAQSGFGMIGSEASALGLDAQAIAAAALREAVRAEKTRRWREENATAIAAQHEWVEKNELPLAKYRMFALPERHGEV
jgi:antitoxin CcdA